MKAIVLGATGFIGSHVAEQLVLAGHEVVALVRSREDNPFLQKLGIVTQSIDLWDTDQLRKNLTEQSVVYNCIAYRGAGKTLDDFRTVEVDLTCQILEGAIQAHVQRYVQLSSIIVYGTPTSPKPINETFPAHPELVIDQAAWEREQMVRTMGSERGLDTVILQPASTIGQRDQGSFFHRIYQAHIQNKFPLIGNGMARFSCVDTRDIGRAMVWLGEADTSVRGETYLLKGYDTSWLELKTALDQARGVVSGAQRLPSWMAFGIAGLLERVMVTPSLDRRTVRALTTDRIYDNRKLRGTGFAPRYQLAESIEEALAEKKNR